MITNRKLCLFLYMIDLLNFFEDFFISFLVFLYGSQIDKRSHYIDLKNMAKKLLSKHTDIKSKTHSKLYIKYGQRLFYLICYGFTLFNG